MLVLGFAVYPADSYITKVIESAMEATYSQFEEGEHPAPVGGGGFPVVPPPGRGGGFFKNNSKTVTPHRGGGIFQKI